MVSLFHVFFWYKLTYIHRTTACDFVSGVSGGAQKAFKTWNDVLGAWQGFCFNRHKPEDCAEVHRIARSFERPIRAPLLPPLILNAKSAPHTPPSSPASPSSEHVRISSPTSLPKPASPVNPRHRAATTTASHGPISHASPFTPSRERASRASPSTPSHGQTIRPRAVAPSTPVKSRADVPSTPEPQWPTVPGAPTSPRFYVIEGSPVIYGNR